MVDGIARTRRARRCGNGHAASLQVDCASITSTMLTDVKVNRADPTDLYEQVAGEIRRAIADGEAKPGERLPPAKDLAAILDVNTNTVLRALRLLRDEGLLEFRRGRGITVAGTPERGAVIHDALEGSIRTVGMIKWPGKIAPRPATRWCQSMTGSRRSPASSARQVPSDRPIDGVDQSAFLTGKQANSNRESLISFIGEEVAAVRWRHFRIYPKQFVPSTGNPAMYGLAGTRVEMNGFPAIFNIEADPREEVNILGTTAWVIGPYLKLIGDYRKTLEQHPNPKAVNMTQFGRVIAMIFPFGKSTP